MTQITDPLEILEAQLSWTEDEISDLEESLNIRPRQSLQWRELDGRRQAYKKAVAILRKAR